MNIKVNIYEVTAEFCEVNEDGSISTRRLPDIDLYVIAYSALDAKTQAGVFLRKYSYHAGFATLTQLTAVESPSDVVVRG